MITLGEHGRKHIILGGSWGALAKYFQEMWEQLGDDGFCFRGGGDWEIMDFVLGSKEQRLII